MNYRYLEPGEVILPGDEFMFSTGNWVPDVNPGKEVQHWEAPYRRPILPTSPPTLALPITSGEYHNATGQRSIVLAIVDGRAMGYVHPIGSPPRECSWSAQTGEYTGMFSHAVDLAHRVEIEGGAEG